MIRRMSDEHKIDFLELKNNIEEQKKSSSKEEKTLKQLSTEQKAKKLSNKDNGLMTSHHISSAKSGIISNENGPTKFTKSETSNTIFDNDKSSRLANEVDSKTRIKKEKEEIVSNRRFAEEKRMNDLVESLKETEQAKDSNVQSAGHYRGSNYYSPKNNISIFDSKEFERLADKTSGEVVSEENNKKRAEKDESWKHNGKALSSKDVVNNLFDSLMNREK